MFLLGAMIFLLSAPVFSQEANNSEVLTNSSLITMKEKGFSDEVIIALINNAKSNFDTSLTGLENLKKAGISDEVISIVITQKGVMDYLNNLNTNNLVYLTKEDIKEQNNELKIAEEYTIKKGTSIKVNLPIQGQDFITIEPKKRVGLKMLGQVADIVGTGAFAVGLGSSNISTKIGAIEAMNKANAVRYGVDALDKIQELDISKNAKKIAGKEFIVKSWEYDKDKEQYVINGEINKKKYTIDFPNALIFNEVILK